jgi:hypothetical protein
MALDKSALLELTEVLSSADGGQLMRRLLHTILQALIDAEAAEHIGADPHERTDTRTTYRNGTRDKTMSTTSGDLTVKIAKTRTGSFFPSLLTPRRRIDVASEASHRRVAGRVRTPWRHHSLTPLARTVLACARRAGNPSAGSAGSPDLCKRRRDHALRLRRHGSPSDATCAARPAPSRDVRTSS